MLILFAIGLLFTACEGAEGPEGTIGQKGAQGPDGIVKVVDADGKVVGESISGNLIDNGSYTFSIVMATGAIITDSWYIYASEVNQGGILYGSTDFAIYQNYIDKYNFGYFRAKDRNANGYALEVENVTTESMGDDSGWSNITSTGIRVKVEKIDAAADDSYFIGFVPTPPLRYVW
jgi:hypothetical protein